MVLKYLALKSNESNLISAREICDQFDIPFDTTSKVMQQLGIAGILKSVKGVKGGYYLGGDLTQVSYSQLVELIEGKDLTFDCDGGGCNLITKCNISGPIKKLGALLDDFFNNINLQQLLSEELPFPSQVNNHEWDWEKIKRKL